MQDLFINKFGQPVFTLLKGLAAYGIAELSVRIVRLITVIFIARRLAPDIVGHAALTLTLFEILRVLANIGVGQKIIIASADTLDATCNTARRIFWLWCAGVAVVQNGVALILAYVFHQPLSAQMLSLLSLVYFWMPGGLVQCFLLMRAGRASTTARTSAIQTISDHIITAALLLYWPSPWAVVMPKLLTAPIWLILTRRAMPWRPNHAAGLIPYPQLMTFGISILATEMLLAVRSQADKLIIAGTLGVTALGTYYFAFNAGIGIVSSLLSAFSTVLFPILCAEHSEQMRAQRLKMAVGLGCLLFLPMIALQSGLAQIYVPVIFGARWSHAAPLIAILCLAGIPLLAAATTTAWLRATQRPEIDVKANLISCILALSGLFLGAQWGGLTGAAMGWICGLALSIFPFAIMILARPLSPSNQYLTGATA